MEKVKVIYNGKRIEIAKDAYLIDLKKPDAERKYILGLPVDGTLRIIMFGNSRSLSEFREAVEEHVHMKIDDKSLGGLIYRCFGDYRDFHTLMCGDIFMLGVKESGKDVSEFLSDGAMRDIVHAICYQDEVILREIFHAHAPLSYDADTVSVRLPMGSRVEAKGDFAELTLTYAATKEKVDSLDDIKTHIPAEYYLPAVEGVGVDNTCVDGVFVLSKDDHIIHYTELKYDDHVFKYRSKKELFASKIQVNASIPTYNYELGEYELKPYWFKIKVPGVGNEEAN